MDQARKITCITNIFETGRGANLPCPLISWDRFILNLFIVILRLLIRPCRSNGVSTLSLLVIIVIQCLLALWLLKLVVLSLTSCWLPVHLSTTCLINGILARKISLVLVLPVSLHYLLLMIWHFWGHVDVRETWIYGMTTSRWSLILLTPLLFLVLYWFINLPAKKLIYSGVVIIRAKLTRLEDDVITYLVTHTDLGHCCLKLVKLFLRHLWHLSSLAIARLSTVWADPPSIFLATILGATTVAHAEPTFHSLHFLSHCKYTYFIWFNKIK